MLYDNALLARAYLHGYQALGHERWREVATETLDWVLAEMRGPEGGFYSALDADSEGEEGRFYVWTPAELRVCSVTPASRRGRRADHLLRGLRGGQLRGAEHPACAGRAGREAPERLDEPGPLYASARETRLAGLDDKRLCSWNALVIAALAEAGAVLARDDHLDAARRRAGVLWPPAPLRRRAPSPVLEGRRGAPRRLPRGPRLPGRGVAVLYEATFDVRWFAAARDTADPMVERFAHPDHGGFVTVAHADERLIVAARTSTTIRSPPATRRPPTPSFAWPR